jgi:hypothetical protein
MFEQLLKTAMESGGEVIIETKYYCECVKGKVLSLDNDHVSIFHSGTDGGMLWVFGLKDIACCGLVLELPQSLSQLSLFQDASLQQITESLQAPCQHHQTEGD